MMRSHGYNVPMKAKGYDPNGRHVSGGPMHDYHQIPDHFWEIPLDSLLGMLETSPNGLSTTEAERRRQLFGSNTVKEEKRYSAILEFLRFFANPLVLILMVASLVSFLWDIG